MARALNGYRINFGPQHPAAHGVLRLIIDLQGEEIRNVDAQIGLLHRGTEKLCENRTLLQALPYWDRLDYVSTMSLEYTFSKAVESALALAVPSELTTVRIIFVELTRILNHLLAVTTHAMDVGALTPFLWGFEEREKIMEFYERVCGARLHANFIRPYGVAAYISAELLLDIYTFTESCARRLDQIDEVLTRNRIWCERLVHVGLLDVERALALGCTGVVLRSTGCAFDLRTTEPDYQPYRFDIPVGTEGDCYDRYVLRMAEMRQSLIIIQHAITNLLSYRVTANNNSRDELKHFMEQLITHFKKMSEGLILLPSQLYYGSEAPKGEMGMLLMGNGTSYPTRMKIRAPGFYHLQAINTLCSRGLLADFVTIIGTLDLVLGEIDR